MRVHRGADDLGLLGDALERLPGEDAHQVGAPQAAGVHDGLGRLDAVQHAVAFGHVLERQWIGALPVHEEVIFLGVVGGGHRVGDGGGEPLDLVPEDDGVPLRRVLFEALDETEELADVELVVVDEEGDVGAGGQGGEPGLELSEGVVHLEGEVEEAVDLRAELARAVGAAALGEDPQEHLVVVLGPVQPPEGVIVDELVDRPFSVEVRLRHVEGLERPSCLVPGRIDVLRFDEEVRSVALLREERPVHEAGDQRVVRRRARGDGVHQLDDDVLAEADADSVEPGELCQRLPGGAEVPEISAEDHGGGRVHALDRARQGEHVEHRVIVGREAEQGRCLIGGRALQDLIEDVAVPLPEIFQPGALVREPGAGAERRVHSLGDGDVDELAPEAQEHAGERVVVAGHRRTAVEKAPRAVAGRARLGAP